MATFKMALKLIRPGKLKYLFFERNAQSGTLNLPIYIVALEVSVILCACTQAKQPTLAFLLYVCTICLST